MDWKVEVVTIPVSDVERARDFYAQKLDNVGCVFFSDPDGNRWCVQQIPARNQ